MQPINLTSGSRCLITLHKAASKSMVIFFNEGEEIFHGLYTANLLWHLVVSEHCRCTLYYRLGVLEFPRLSREPSSKKARLTLTTDELVVPKRRWWNWRLRWQRLFRRGRIWSWRGRPVMTPLNIWKAILHLILKTKQSVWSFPQIGC